MKPSQAVRFGIAAVVVVVLSAACMHPSDSGSSASGSSSGSSTSASTTSPAIEQTTGLESPQSPTHGNPSLSLPSPPVGNNNHNDGGECIQITWLTRPIPHGDIVEITSVTLPESGPFTFDPGVAARCKGGRSCVGYQFSEFNDNAEAFCNVGVGYIGGTIDPGTDNSESGSMELAGQLSCPHISSAECRNDAVVMKAAAKSPISFNADIVPNTKSPTSPPPENTTSSPPVSPPTSPETSDSSSPVAPGSP